MAYEDNRSLIRCLLKILETLTPWEYLVATPYHKFRKFVKKDLGNVDDCVDTFRLSNPGIITESKNPGIIDF